MTLTPSEYSNKVDYCVVALAKECDLYTNCENSINMVALRSLLSVDTLSSLLGVVRSYGVTKSSKLASLVKESGAINGAIRSIIFLGNTALDVLAEIQLLFSHICNGGNINRLAESYELQNIYEVVVQVLKTITHSDSILKFAAHAELIQAFTVDRVVGKVLKLAKAVTGCLELFRDVYNMDTTLIQSVATQRFEMLRHGEYKAVFFATVLGLTFQEGYVSAEVSLKTAAKQNRKFCKVAAKVCGVSAVILGMLSTSSIVIPLGLSKVGFTVLADVFAGVDKEFAARIAGDKESAAV